MNILLINPLWSKDTKSIFRYLYGVFPPLGIALLASILEQDGHRVRIIDCAAHEIIPADIIKHISEKFDFIGITGASQSAPMSYELAKVIKKNFDTPIIMGGIHATAMPDEVIGNPYIDICVRAEGEETIKEIVMNKALSTIKGISYKADGRVIHNPNREPIADLDSYPLPAYHLLPMKLYRSMLGVSIKWPSIGLIISRGCPGKCEYCYPNSLGDKVRMKSPGRILEELLLLKNDYRFKEVDFYDDTFTFFKNKVVEICDLLIQNKVGLTWSCLTRPDFVDEPLLKRMKEAGCHQLMYGIESGSSEIRKKINKKVDVDFKKIIKMTQRSGIQVRATYMIGNYDERYEDVLKTISFAKYVNSDLAVFNVCTPFPGTALYRRLEAEGRILTEDWSKYDFFNVVFKHPYLTAKEIIYLYKQANKEFYFRPIIFIRQLMALYNFNRMILLFRISIAIIKGLINWR
ncbi:MAG: radical SAM protein [Candidatus Omnitrophica bacterium]|nr:radical SAM protein [Candidatus Omnitrophota bacterium]